MEADLWSILSSTSRRRQPSHLPRFDESFGFEMLGAGEDEQRVEFPCPFCSEDFDLFALCCHIDDAHPDEDKNGVCPVCGDRVVHDMVNHITMQHRSYFKMQRRKHQKSSSNSHRTLSFLKKELPEGNLHTRLGGPSSFLIPAGPTTDPLLFSFVNCLPPSGSTNVVKPSVLEEERIDSEYLDKKVAERFIQATNFSIVKCPTGVL